MIALQDNYITLGKYLHTANIEIWMKVLHIIIRFYNNKKATKNSIFYASNKGICRMLENYYTPTCESTISSSLNRLQKDGFISMEYNVYHKLSKDKKPQFFHRIIKVNFDKIKQLAAILSIDELKKLRPKSRERKFAKKRQFSYLDDINTIEDDIKEFIADKSIGLKEIRALNKKRHQDYIIAIQLKYKKYTSSLKVETAREKHKKRETGLYCTAICNIDTYVDPETAEFIQDLVKGIKR